MDLAARDGRLRRIGWTRMVLFDTERIPVLTGDPAGSLRERIVQYLRAHASRPEIVVTFRHLEEGWVDTPEPRRDRGRRRRKGRGEARGGGGERPGRRPETASSPNSRPSARPAARPAAARPAAAPTPPVAGSPRGRRPTRGATPPLPAAPPGKRTGGSRSAAGRHPMNFDLSEDQASIRDAVREFAEGEVAPGVAERERDERFPRELLPKLGELGFLGMMVPEEHGGAGLDALSYILAVEELARVCASTAVIMSVNNSVFCYPIWKYGSDRQKREILSEVASGRSLGAYALSEPQSGSDAANQKPGRAGTETTTSWTALILGHEPPEAWLVPRYDDDPPELGHPRDHRLPGECRDAGSAYG